MTLDQAEVLLAKPEQERRVEYRPAGRIGAAPEQGVVTGVSGHYVFVRYDGDTHAQATYPTDLYESP